jgi:hypothetical protein
MAFDESPPEAIERWIGEHLRSAHRSTRTEWTDVMASFRDAFHVPAATTGRSSLVDAISAGPRHEGRTARRRWAELVRDDPRTTVFCTSYSACWRGDLELDDLDVPNAPRGDVVLAHTELAWAFIVSDEGTSVLLLPLIDGSG